VKFGRVVFEICEQTDKLIENSKTDRQTGRHTKTLITILRNIPGTKQ